VVGLAGHLETGGRVMSVERFGSNLRRVRKSARMTLRDLQEKTGVSFTHISDIERGQSRPSLDVAYRLAEAVDTDLLTLIEYEPPARCTHHGMIVFEGFPGGMSVLCRGCGARWTRKPEDAS
jgi:DNA-binding XRE family transcriptional regulator